LLDVVLLALKAGFLVLLYVFIWLVMRGAARDVLSWGRTSEPLGAVPSGAVLPPVAPSPWAGSAAVPSSHVEREALPAEASSWAEPAASPPDVVPVAAALPPLAPASPQPVGPPPPEVGPEVVPEPGVLPEQAVDNAPEAAAGAAASPLPADIGVADEAPFGGAAAAGALAAAAPAPEATPEERRARREARERERSMAGERLDFSDVINPRLVVEESPVLEVGSRIPLAGWVTIGRSPASDIVLADPFVSSTHARLVPRGQLYFVEDLGSTNGTFVGGREVTDAQLKPDDRLHIGETTFRYEE
jgi:hypothetical protein